MKLPKLRAFFLKLFTFDYKYANEFDGGIISTPQLANDIATAILEEHYTKNCIEKNKPFSISKDITTWNINGMCYSHHNGFVFGFSCIFVLIA